MNEIRINQPGTAYQYKIADMNGDKKPDLVVATSTIRYEGRKPIRETNLSVCIGNGDGTFQDARLLGIMQGSLINRSVGGSADAGTATQEDNIMIADLNGDGKPDITVGTYENENISIGKEIDFKHAFNVPIIGVWMNDLEVTPNKNNTKELSSSVIPYK